MYMISAKTNLRRRYGITVKMLMKWKKIDFLFECCFCVNAFVLFYFCAFILLYFDLSKNSHKILIFLLFHFCSIEKRQEFERRRKLHYNEFEAVRLARQLMEEDEEEDESIDVDQSPMPSSSSNA